MNSSSSTTPSDSERTPSHNKPPLPPLNTTREDIPYRTLGIPENINTIANIPVLWDIAIDECGVCKSLTGQNTRKGDCQVECLNFFNIMTSETAIAFSNSLGYNPHEWAKVSPNIQEIADYISRVNADATGQNLIRYNFQTITLNKETLYDYLFNILKGPNNPGSPHSTFIIFSWEVNDPTSRGTVWEGGKRYASHLVTIGLTRQMEVSMFDTQMAETSRGGVYTGKAGLEQYFGNQYPYELVFGILCRMPSGGDKKHTRKYKRSNIHKRSVKRSNRYKRSINRSNRPKRSVKRNNRHKQNYKRMTRGGKKCRR